MADMLQQNARHETGSYEPAVKKAKTDCVESDTDSAVTDIGDILDIESEDLMDCDVRSNELIDAFEDVLEHYFVKEKNRKNMEKLASEWCDLMVTNATLYKRQFHFDFAKGKQEPIRSTDYYIGYLQVLYGKKTGKKSGEVIRKLAKNWRRIHVINDRLPFKLKLTVRATLKDDMIFMFQRCMVRRNCGF